MEATVFPSLAGASLSYVTVGAPRLINMRADIGELPSNCEARNQPEQPSKRSGVLNAEVERHRAVLKDALHAGGARHPSVVAASPLRKSVEGRLVPRTRSAAALGIHDRRGLARQGRTENRVCLDRGALEGSCTQRAHQVLEESQAPAEIIPHSRGVDGVSAPRRRAI